MSWQTATAMNIFVISYIKNLQNFRSISYLKGLTDFGWELPTMVFLKAYTQQSNIYPLCVTITSKEIQTVPCTPCENRVR